MFKRGKALTCEISLERAGDLLERIARLFFTVDGKTSRELMSYPHDPFKEPAFWLKYDQLSVEDRLNSPDGVSSWEKDPSESNVNTFGSASGNDIVFTEALRWYALGGYSMAGIFELAGVCKFGNGGCARNLHRLYWGYAL